MKKLNIALGLGNADAIERHAHIIKEESLKIGAYPIKNIAFKIEFSARKGRIDEVGELYSKIEKEIKKIKSDDGS